MEKDIHFIVYDHRLETPVFVKYEPTAMGYHSAELLCELKNKMARGRRSGGRYSVRLFNYETREYLKFKPEEYKGVEYGGAIHNNEIRHEM